MIPIIICLFPLLQLSLTSSVPLPLPPPIDGIIGAVERFELEAKKEKEDMKQQVESMEEKYKRLMGSFDEFKSFGTKLNNLDMNLRSLNKNVEAEFRKRDKAMIRLISKKLLPKIRSMISRMDVIDEKLTDVGTWTEKMEDEDNHYEGEKEPGQDYELSAMLG